MNGYQIAAIIGAFAWLPFIFGLIGKIFSRPKVYVILPKVAEIGLTTYGPICNLRIAFSTSRRDLVITEINLIFKHSDGERKEFSWQGLVQNIGQFGDINRGIIPHDKEYSVLAMKVLTSNIEERFIRFQNTDYLQKKQVLIEKANDKIQMLIKAGTYKPEEFIKSEELQKLIQYCSQNATWKSGEYTIDIVIKSNKPFSIKNNLFRFSLSSTQITDLETNKSKFESAFKNELMHGVVGFIDESITWNWSFPLLKY